MLPPNLFATWFAHLHFGKTYVDEGRGSGRSGFQVEGWKGSDPGRCRAGTESRGAELEPSRVGPS